MTRCVMKDGEECTDMQEANKKLEQIEVKLKDHELKISKKVSWGYITLIASSILGSIIITIFWFADIRALAKDFPKEKEKIEQHAKDISKLDERTTLILSSQSKTNELLQKLIDLKQDDNAKKIASKELKEYNDVKNN